MKKIDLVKCPDCDDLVTFQEEDLAGGLVVTPSAHENSAGQTCRASGAGLPGEEMRFERVQLPD